MSCRLHIKICEAKKVLKMYLGGKSDPYITLRLKSQSQNDFQKTQIIRNTTDPIWNQEFDIIATDPNDVLYINMCDDYTKDKMMNELQYPVNSWAIGGPLEHIEIDVKLQKKTAGKLIFEVQSFPSVNPSIESVTKGCKIRIKAFDANNVLKMNLGGKADPYLRFRFKGKKDSTVKTATAINTLNPIWNQELEIISTDKQNDVLQVDMLDEDIKNDDKMMNCIEIPLQEHPNKTRYTFDNDIKLKKKDAGHLHFELDFESIGDDSSETDKKEDDDDDDDEESTSNTNYSIQLTNNKIKLLTNSLLHVPLNTYENDFTFIVNDQRYKTSRVVSDLISPTVSMLHQNDPTVSEFVIKTSTKGDFQTILDLVSFETKEINNEEEIDYIAEVFEQLGIESASVKTNNIQLSIDNVIELIARHERLTHFYQSRLEYEIEYLSGHMYQMKENQVKQFLNLSLETIERVISNENLRLESEDQLLNLINQLYIQKNVSSNLYEFVFFSNVESETIDEFLSIFDFNDLTSGTWLSLSKRIRNEVKTNKQPCNRKYRKDIKYSNGNFNGIFNYLQKNSNIEEEIGVTCSSCGGGDWHQLINIESTNNCYFTNNESNPWICFEFKKRRVVPKNYTIRSYNSSSGNRHPKSWIIEGSEDNAKWIKIDEQHDCSFLNGPKRVHTFNINADNVGNKEFKFIRIRHINNTWDNYNNAISICSIEFYGNLI